MTYIDRYMELHPYASRESVMESFCPNNEFVIESEPITYCAFDHLSNGLEDCKMWWKRTYRGERIRSDGQS